MGEALRRGAGWGYSPLALRLKRVGKIGGGESFS